VDAEQYVSILNDHLLPSIEESGILKTLSSSKTMTQSTHPKRPMEWFDNQDKLFYDGSTLLDETYTTRSFLLITSHLQGYRDYGGKVEIHGILWKEVRD